MPSTIQGIYAATVTPRRLGVQDINLGVMWDLIDFLVGHGVSGIVLCGSTGEYIHYSNSERMRVMGLAPKRSKVPILVNVSHSNFDGAVELGQAAQASGAAGVLLMPPYFFRYSQAECEAFYRRFVEDAELQIPLFLYNIPIFTNPLLFDTIQRLLADGIAQGVKDSTGDWGEFEKLHHLRSHSPFTLMIGNDGLYAKARQQGADGAVSGVAAAIPELLVALDKATLANSQHASHLASRIDEFVDRSSDFAAPIAIREAVGARGFKLGPPAVPLVGPQDTKCGEFREWFQAWLPGVLRECNNA